MKAFKRLLLILSLFQFLTIGNLAAKDGKNKWQKRYNQASPEKKARMDKRKKEMEGMTKAERMEYRKKKKEERKSKRQARWQERYDKASPEKQAKMKAEKAKIQKMTKEQRRTYLKERRAKRQARKNKASNN